MSPEDLLVPILVGSIVVAVVLAALTFVRHDTPADRLQPAQNQDPAGPPEEEGDGWYFVKHQPPEQHADLSLS